MKKIIVTWSAISALVLSALGIAACNGGHAHQTEHHSAISATCEMGGNAEYWYCGECDKYYADEECRNEVSYFDVIIPALGHDLQDVGEKPATCTEAGNTAGQKCSRCDYSTAQKINALGHDMTHHAEEPATCTADGKKEHWTCSREEGVFYADKEGKAELDDLTVPALGHEMDYVDAIAVSCMQDGMVAHWVCANEPNVYYLDEDAAERIDEIVIPATGHAWAEDWEIDETSHWHVCNNGCGELGNYESHLWDDGIITIPPTTASKGEMVFNCKVCPHTKTEILSELGAFDFTVSEIDIFNNEDGGSVSYITDALPQEDGKYVEGTKFTVTVTVNEGFGIGSVKINGEELIYSPLCTNGVYTFEFVIKDDTELSVEFGIPVTTNRTWKLTNSDGYVNYLWEYYTVDAAGKNEEGKTVNGTAMFLAFDATGIEDVRAHDFSADPVILSYKLDGGVSWANIDNEIKVTWLSLISKLPENERILTPTLAFAIRLLPSEPKRLSGYVGSELILPTATAVGETNYDMTMEYSYSKEDLTAPSAAQISFNEDGSILVFLLSDSGRGSVFNKYHAAYVEIEISKGEEKYYAYLFDEDGKLNMYSSLDRSGTPLLCDTVGNGWVHINYGTNSFNNWALLEYPGSFIIATLDWEFKTKVHVDENSVWAYDGEWSDPVKYVYVGFSYSEAPSFAQLGINSGGSAIEFIRTGGAGKVFTQFYAAYVEIAIKKGDAIYYAYLFNVDGTAYLYDNVNKEGEGLDCHSVEDAYVWTTDFNRWASKVFEEDFKALEWEYRTKVHVDENSIFWPEDGEWSEVIKYGS